MYYLAHHTSMHINSFDSIILLIFLSLIVIAIALRRESDET